MKLTLDEIRVVRRMRERGAAVTHLAKDLGVTEGTVRYRLKRLEEGDRLDGRAGQATALDGYEEAVEAIQERLGDGRLGGEGRPCQVRLIYEALVGDHGYAGSYQSVVRHLRRKHGKPRVRAIRRWRRRRGFRRNTIGSRSGFRSGGGYWIWRCCWGCCRIAGRGFVGRARTRRSCRGTPGTTRCSRGMRGFRRGFGSTTRRRR